LNLRRGAPVAWLIVGLGNPGREYVSTRHNVGFAVIDELARRWGIDGGRDRFRGRLREGRAGAGGPHVALLEPQTFMNDAGRIICSSSTTRSTSRSARSAPGSAADWPDTTG
jgi:peptidyl-tRNA hydrolase